MPPPLGSISSRLSNKSFGVNSQRKIGLKEAENVETWPLRASNMPSAQPARRNLVVPSNDASSCSDWQARRSGATPVCMSSGQLDLQRSLALDDFVRVRNGLAFDGPSALEPLLFLS